MNELGFSTESTLQVLAELGVALAGFVALIAIFTRSKEGKWSPQVMSAVRYMIELSLALLILGLLPFPLAFLGLDQEQVWMVASAVMSLVWIAMMILNLRRRRALLRTGWRPSTPLFRSVGLVLAASGLVGNVINVAVTRAPGLYIGGLFVLVVLITLPFLALVTRAGSGEH